MKNRLIKGPLKAVLFDFDGTLTIPNAIDFDGIRSEIGCPIGLPILEYIEAIRDPQTREQANAILESTEIAAAADSIPHNGAEEIVAYIRSRALKTAIISRNGLSPIKKALDNFDQTSLADFDVIITREDDIAPKPSPEAIELALSRLNIEAGEAIMVGDYVFDIIAGQAAGVPSILLHNAADTRSMAGCDPNIVIKRLLELKDIIEAALPLTGGKIPNRFLHSFFNQFPPINKSLIIPPGVGEDVSAIDIKDEELAIVKSDPITFSASDIGKYAILINSNDIATSGAIPKWFMSTLLFPPGSTPNQILTVMTETRTACESAGINLCGGHTEITDAVNRPIICGTMIGTVKRDHLIDKSNIQPGDQLLVTKQIGIEGTAVIASDFSGQLKDAGWSGTEIQAARSFINLISIAPEAGLASQSPYTSGMHDVTEGGLATALSELCQYRSFSAQIWLDKIPIHNITARICDVFNLDPMGLIGSGSLIISVRPEGLYEVMASIQSARIQVSHIGEVTDKIGQNITAIQNLMEVAWPVFDKDELTRLF